MTRDLVDMPPILVTGATGRIGRAVIAGLVGAGVPVRALTSNPATAALPASVDVVAGDFTGPESLSQAEQVSAIGYPAFVTSTLADILGAPERTFRQWIFDHADAFRKSAPE